MGRNFERLPAVAHPAGGLHAFVTAGQGIGHRRNADPNCHHAIPFRSGQMIPSTQVRPPDTGCGFRRDAPIRLTCRLRL